MNPAAIIREAAADGVSLALSPAGTIKATGDQAAVSRWLPVLREHKAALLAALAHPDPPGMSGEFIPSVHTSSVEQEAVLRDARGPYNALTDAALLGIPGDPDRPGISLAALDAGVEAAVVRDLFVRPEHLEALKADPLWWRVGILEPGGRTIEVDTPSGWTLGEWTAYAERYHGPGCGVTPIAGLPKPRAPVNLDEVLAGACDGVAGITPEVFRSLLSPEDLQDIAAGNIAVETLRGFAESFSEGMRLGRIVVPGGEP